MAPRRLLALAALAAAAATRAPSLEAWINDLELIIDEKFEQKISGIKVSVKDIECDDLELGSLTAEYQKGDEGCRTDICTDNGGDCCAPTHDDHPCRTDICTDNGNDCCAPARLNEAKGCSLPGWSPETGGTGQPGESVCKQYYEPTDLYQCCRDEEPRGCSEDGYVVTPGGTGKPGNTCLQYYDQSALYQCCKGAPAAVAFGLGDIGMVCKGKWSAGFLGDGKVNIEIKDTSASTRIHIDKDELGNPKTLQFLDCNIKIQVKDIKFSGNALSGIANAFEKQLKGFIEDMVEKQGCKAIKDVEVSMAPVVNFFPTCSTRPPGTFVKNKTDPVDWVDWQWFLENGKGPGAAVASQLWKMKEKKGLKANDIVHKLLKELDKMNVPLVRTVWKSKFYGAFVLNHRVVLHAIDATPGRRRGGVDSPPLDRARTAALLPRSDLVKNCRVHPTHCLISTQVSDKNLELKDFTNWDWFTPKYYKKKCKKGKCEPETVANVSLDLLGTTVVSEYGALADIPKKDLECSMDTPGGPEVSADVLLPEYVGFAGNATLDVSATPGRDLGGQFLIQKSLAPPVRIVVDVGASLDGSVGMDVKATLGIEPDKTKRGAAAFVLGDAVEKACLFDAVAFQDTRIDEMKPYFGVGPVDIYSSVAEPDWADNPTCTQTMCTDLNGDCCAPLHLNEARGCSGEGYLPEPCPSCINPSCTQYYPQSAVYQCCKPTSITLENALAEQLVPSLVSYVDNEFHGFLECLLDSVIQIQARRAVSASLRKFVGPEEYRNGKLYEKHQQKCAKRPDWCSGDTSKHTCDQSTEDAPGPVVALDESSVLKTAAGLVKSANLASAVDSLMEDMSESSLKKYCGHELAKDKDVETCIQEGGRKGKTIKDSYREQFVRNLASDDYLVLAKNGGGFNMGFIDTKVEIRDVYLYRPDKMFAGDGYLKVLPNGKKSLLDKFSIEAATAHLGYDKDYPVTVGATLYVKGPFGKAYTNVTVRLKRVRVPRVVGQVWVDEHAFNGLRGEDWGLDELFTKGGHLTWQCAVGSLQAFRLATKKEVESIDSPNNKPTKVHIGSASVEAVSDIPAFAELVEQAAGLIYHKGNIADQEHVKEQAIWMLNDILFDLLKTFKKQCLKKRPEARVAPKVDQRGPRPIRTYGKQGDGISQAQKDTVMAIVVIMIICFMALAFFLVSTRRRYRKRGSATWIQDHVVPEYDGPNPDPRGSIKAFHNIPSDVAASEDAPAGAVKATSSDDKPIEAEKVESDDLFSVDAPENEPSKNALIFDAPGHAVLRWALVVILVTNVGLLISSHIQIAAEVTVILRAHMSDVGTQKWNLDTGESFSMVESVHKLAQAGQWLLVFLIAGLSGAWPYLEVVLLLYAYLMPGLKPGFRNSFLRTVEMLSKWSFIDIFIVVLFEVAFNVNVRVRADPAWAKLDIYVEARYGYYMFCFATLVSMIVGQIMLAMQRHVHGLGVPIDAQPHEEKHRVEPLMNHSLHGSPPRWWQKLVPIAAIIMACLLAGAYAVDILKIKVGGLAGWVIDETGHGDSTETYTAPELFTKLPGSTPDDNYRPYVNTLMVGCIFFAFVFPLLHCVLVAALWAVPLEARSQKTLLAWAEWSYGWASLDVLLVAILATAIQLPRLVKGLVKGPCKEVDGALSAFMENALGGDTTCFRLEVRIRPGMVFLAFVAVLHMLFGALAAHNGNTAVAERVAAETDLPVKRRSSFEPEAAEEVKEDDKEAEKKGFSMWESISAQVKSVFPAEEAAPSISRQNSPLHVEADV